MVTMTLTSLSIMLTVFILQLHHAGPSRRRCVPSWMRQIFFRMAPALGIRHPAVRRCRPRNAGHSQFWRARSANSVNADSRSTSPADGGYLPLTVRDNIVENATSRQTKRPGRGTVHEDLITRHLTLCLDRHRADQEFEDIITEWRLVATIIDRLMFWAFLLGTAASAVVILVILPLTKSDIKTLQ